MAFPDLPRVVYANNPIVEVVCQLRFPTILKIDVGEPVDFQEKIREHYPIYREDELQPTIPDEIKKLLATEMPFANVKPARRFISADRQWMVSLARNFLAVATESYWKWEDFKTHLTRATTALEELYAPSFYSRIGLRYKNVIRRSDVGLEDVPWDQVLRPHIAAELATVEVAPAVEEAKRSLLVALDVGKVRLRHGFVDRKSEDAEVTYSIDNDFFIEEETGPNDVERIINYFNGQARNTFRWCISDRLHTAMAPELQEQVG